MELEKVVKERDELNIKIAKWEESSKSLNILLNSQMSAHDKNGLGYGTQLNEMSDKSETDSEISMSVFEVRSSDEESTPANDRFSKADGYHVVPPPITGNFLTPRADISFAGLDEYAIRKKIIESKTTELNADTSKSKTSETVGNTNEVNVEKPKSVNESVVSTPNINKDKVIIEDWNSDDEDDVSEVSPVKTNETQTAKTQVDKIGQTSKKAGIGFKKIKACFVCKSTDHLIKDCDFYDKKSPEPKLKCRDNPESIQQDHAGCILVLALESIKDAQAAEISALKSRIKKLEKKYKPSISHHRAWLKSVSMKKRFDHSMEYMETKEAVDEGRQSEVSTADHILMQARQEIVTVEPRTPLLNNNKNKFDDEDITMAQTLIKMKEEKAKEKGVSIKDVEDSSRPARSILTLKPLPTIDPKDKVKLSLEEPDFSKKMTRSDFDAAQIARDAEIARQLQDLQAEVERERQKEEEASKAAIAEMYDEVQAGIDANALAAQRSAEIRSRPPTKSQLRNLMMTYLKNMGGYKHSQLKAKSFEEIKGMYERQKKYVQDFVPIGSAKEERISLCAIVYCLTLELVDIYMLIERIYPIPADVCQAMLDKKLQGDKKVKACYQLLKLKEKQA
ncbi:hypothetical protein Tco_1400134 [Tanacetum coccineum]